MREATEPVLLALQAHEGDEFAQISPGSLPDAVAGAPLRAEVLADAQVLHHGHRLEGLRDLEGAGHAQMGHPVGRETVDALAVEQDVARTVEEAGDEVEDGGLAGAVRSGHAEDLALLHLEGEVVDGGEFAEALGHMLKGRAAP